MTDSPTPSEAPATYHNAMTVADFLAAISGVADDAPLVVGVRDHQHFNRLLGDFAVHRVTVDRGPNSQVVILDVEHLS